MVIDVHESNLTWNRSFKKRFYLLLIAHNDVCWQSVNEPCDLVCFWKNKLRTDLRKLKHGSDVLTVLFFEFFHVLESSVEQYYFDSFQR